MTRVQQVKLMATMAALEEQLLEALLTARAVERGFDLSPDVLSERIHEIREAARHLRADYEHLSTWGARELQVV